MLTGTHSYTLGLNWKNGLNLEVLTRNPEHSNAVGSVAKSVVLEYVATQIY